MKILLTTTSYQDCPGDHHALLESTGAEIVCERGPLSEAQMLELAGDFEAFLCGDDEITQAVIDQSLPKLKVIAKYGIGVDKIDVAYATKRIFQLASALASTTQRFLSMFSCFFFRSIKI